MRPQQSYKVSKTPRRHSHWKWQAISGQGLHRRTAKLSEEEVEKLFNNYEAKLSGQMVKSLGKSIINMYSMGACAVLGITNQDALSEDLENNPFLNSALQRFTCELYYRFSSFLAPLRVGIITSRHCLSEHNKNGECGTGDNKNGGDE